MDDKKKLAVMGVLVAVVIAVGAFQFVGGGSPEPAPAKPKAAPKDAAKSGPEAAEVKNALSPAELASRDPFKPETLPGEHRNLPNPISPRTVSKRLESVPELPPFPIDKSGSIGNVSFAPPKAAISYGLSGVILGARPAAVFVDPQGGQRLVQVGEALDGDTRVIGVEKGTAIVSFRGKTLRISGGNGIEK